MPFIEFEPVYDWRRGGWTPVGAPTLSEVWDGGSDSVYASAPANQDWAEVSFPIDTSTLPEGAVITSVTVSVRARRMTLDSQPVPLVVGITSADDTSRVSTRMVHPYGFIWNFTVVDHTRDSLGLPWDRYRLSRTRVQVWAVPRTYGADAVRVYRIWLQVNYKVRPTVVVTAPSGVAESSSPRISWTYSQAEGNREKHAEYRVFTTAQANSMTFNVNTAVPVASGTVEGGLSTVQLDESLVQGSYAVFVKSVSEFGAESLWVRKDFSVVGPYPAIPSSRGDGGSDPLDVVADPDVSAVYVTMRETANLLSVQQASFDSTSDPLEYTGTGCTLSRESEQVFTRGSAGSMKVTSNATGTAVVTSTFVEVPPGVAFTARGNVLTGTGSKSVTMSVQAYTSAYATTGAAVSVTGTVTNTAWKELVSTGTFPTDAAYAKISFSFPSTVSGNAFYVDDVGIMLGGPDSAPSAGGHLSRNLLPSTVATADFLTDSTLYFASDNAASTVSRVTASGTGAHGTNAYQMLYTSVVPSVGYRASGTTYTATSSGTAFTLNKPGTVVDGDLMIAVVTTSTPSAITPPAGWTVVNSVTTEDNHGMYILKRTAVVTDPASWTDGYFMIPATYRQAYVTAYSGAANASEQFVTDNVRSDPSGAIDHATAEVNNTASNAWRVTAFSVRDNVNTSTFTKVNKDPTNYPQQVTYVGKGSTWRRDVDGTSVTITRPTGVQAGDLMVAYVSVRGSSTGPVFGGTFTGWTKVAQLRQPTNAAAVGLTRDVELTVFKRTATSSEPSSWSTTMSIVEPCVITTTVAYRNAADASSQFLTQGYQGDNAIVGRNSDNRVMGEYLTVPSEKAMWAYATTSVGRTGTEDIATHTSPAPFRRLSDHVETANSGSIPGGGTHITLGAFDSSGQSLETSVARELFESSATFQGGIMFSAVVIPKPTTPPAAADETLRKTAVVGASGTFFNTSLYDSTGVIPIGNTRVYGTYSEVSDSVLSWVGVLKPASPSLAGQVSAKMTSTVDVSKVPKKVLDLSGGKMAAVGHFLGSSSGTPYITVEFYRDVTLLRSVTAEGSVFGTSTWTKSSAVFDYPEGTTHVRMKVSATDRANSDTVQFDRLSLAFGDDIVWRNGTGEYTHPVWSHPQVQFSDARGDVFGDWENHPSGVTPEYNPATGVFTFVDHIVAPLRYRRYRARMISYGINGDVYTSLYGTPSNGIELVSTGLWWLKDINAPENNLALRVRHSGEHSLTKKGTFTEFYTMGDGGSSRPTAIVVGSGFVGSVIEIKVKCTNDEYLALQSLVENRKTMFLQSDINDVWWVRPVGDLEVTSLATGQRLTNPLREVTVRFVEVDKET